MIKIGDKVKIKTWETLTLKHKQIHVIDDYIELPTPEHFNSVMDKFIDTLNRIVTIKDFYNKSTSLFYIEEGPLIISKDVIDYVIEKTNFELVKDFHEKFGMPIENEPTPLTNEACVRRLSLIMSEAGELSDEARKKYLRGIAKELGDLLYVTYGWGVEAGLDLDRIFKAVHESNMSKVWPDGIVHKDEGGKVLKPETYKEADLSFLGV